MNDPNKIPIDKITDDYSWLSSIVLGAIASMHGTGVDVSSITAAGRERKVLDVRLTIEGVDVPPTAFFAKLGQNYDEHVAASARRLVDERMAEVLGPIGESLGEVGEHVSRLAREAFPHEYLDNCEDS